MNGNEWNKNFRWSIGHEISVQFFLKKKRQKTRQGFVATGTKYWPACGVMGLALLHVAYTVRGLPALIQFVCFFLLICKKDQILQA